MRLRACIQPKIKKSGRITSASFIAVTREYMMLLLLI